MPESDNLKVMAVITSDDVHDPDLVPTYSGGCCYYWGAFKDSPIPDVRVFVVFNKEPDSDSEAFDVVKSHLS
jgi:hypothetical protein